MSHINQPSVSNDNLCLIKTLILPTSALTSDYRYCALPKSPNNLSVCRHMIPDHVCIVVCTTSSLRVSLLLSALKGVQADL
jgi:hypothetical protein